MTHLQAEKKKFSATPTPHSPVDVCQSITNIAIEATGDGPVFGGQLESLDTNQDLPVELGKILETHLRKVLNFSENLYELIRQGEAAEIVGQDVAKFAHRIRIQRKLILHDPSVDQRTKMARALFCLFAASLFFPELSED